MLIKNVFLKLRKWWKLFKFGRVKIVGTFKQQSLYSLNEGSVNCPLCVECINCVDCFDCADCESSSKLDDCTNCISCISCRNCMFLKNSFNCKNLIGTGDSPLEYYVNNIYAGKERFEQIKKMVKII